MARLHEMNETRIGVVPLHAPCIPANVLEDLHLLQSLRVSLAECLHGEGFDLRTGVWMSAVA